MTKDKRVYVSGYWEIQSNVKKSKNVYLYGIAKTLKLLKGCTLYFLTSDSKIKDYVSEQCRLNDITLTIVDRHLDDLPAQKYATQLIKSARLMNLSHSVPDFDYRLSKEKGIIHYYRDLLKAGEDNYNSLLNIWLSKVFLVNEIINDNQFDNTTMVCWIDCTAERFRFTRSNWKFTAQSLCPKRLNHYSGAMKYLGVNLPISAWFMAANKKIWSEVESEFTIEIKTLESSVAYAHDEETLLTNVLLRKPKLSNCLGHPHHTYYATAIEKAVNNLLKRIVYYKHKLHDKFS